MIFKLGKKEFEKIEDARTYRNNEGLYFDVLQIIMNESEYNALMAEHDSEIEKEKQEHFSETLRFHGEKTKLLGEVERLHRRCEGLGEAVGRWKEKALGEKSSNNIEIAEEYVDGMRHIVIVRTEYPIEMYAGLVIKAINPEPYKLGLNEKFGGTGTYFDHYKMNGIRHRGREKTWCLILEGTLKTD